MACRATQNDIQNTMDASSPKIEAFESKANMSTSLQGKPP
jgi:hypothetical protein